jgi:hypothetical protein
MREKTFVVYFKPPSRAVQHVRASRANVRGKHLAFIDRRRGLAGLFSLEIVDRWCEIPEVKDALPPGRREERELARKGQALGTVEQKQRSKQAEAEFTTVRLDGITVQVSQTPAPTDRIVGPQGLSLSV